METTVHVACERRTLVGARLVRPQRHNTSRLATTRAAAQPCFSLTLLADNSGDQTLSSCRADPCQQHAYSTSGSMAMRPSALDCIYADPPSQQLFAGVSCTAQVLPYATFHIWRLTVEWAILAGIATVCCCCCCFCRYVSRRKARGHHRRSQVMHKTASDRHSLMENAEEEGVGAYKGAGSLLGKIIAADTGDDPVRGGSCVMVSISDRNSGAHDGVPPPPSLPTAVLQQTLPPPPPPPPSCGPGGAGSSSNAGVKVYTKYRDPSTGEHYYSDEHGTVTWDEPPLPHKIIDGEDA